MIEYKIKENQEKGIDPVKLTIQKTGEPVEFSLIEIFQSENFAKKMITELEAQIKIDNAKMENVNRTHPHIAEMSEEDRMACYIYQGSFAIVSASTKKIKEFQKQLEDYAQEKAEITAQTGLNLDDEVKKANEIAEANKKADIQKESEANSSAGEEKKA